MKSKVSVPLIILVSLLVIGGVTTFFVLRNVQKEQNDDEVTPELTDEFTRIRWFITDWYDELQTRGKCQVYLNELRFNNGAYSLTFAKDRVRAVYPRGERSFKLEQVNKIEFFEMNGKLICRLSYGRSGEYRFNVN